VKNLHKWLYIRFFMLSLQLAFDRETFYLKMNKNKESATSFAIPFNEVAEKE